MKRFLFFCLQILFLLNTLHAQNIPLLERKISINVNNENIEKTLRLIENKTGITFSYSADRLNVQQNITLNLQNKTVREALNLIFSNTVQYKEKNNYIILQKISEEKNNSSSTIKISGYVMNDLTGEHIPYASIYNTKTLRAVHTDAFGFYSFKMDKPEPQVQLSYNKIHYRDTLVNIETQKFQAGLLNVRMMPLPAEIPIEIPTLKVESLYASIDTGFRLSESKMSMPALLNMNVKDTLHRKWQISLLPYVGSNHKLSARVVNDYSINLLGGVNMGVNKFELGGLFNVNLAYVRRFQLAGLFNYVHGTVDGFQLGGLFNINRKLMRGVQVGGLFNIQLGEMKGHQIGGLFNIAANEVSGAQWGGLFNIASRKTGGAQVGGLFNIAADSVGGLQTAGLFNFVLKSVKGAQIGGLFNIAGEKVQGAQIAGAFNIANEVDGVQASGLINIAKKVNASQIGFLNIADTVKGVPVGVLSFVRTGYISFELSADETFYGNLTFRTGVRKFYNILTAGWRPINGKEPVWSVGYGVGTSPRLSEKFYLNIELSAQQLLNSEYKYGLKLLNRFYLGTDYVFAKRFAVSAGATLNGLLSDVANPRYVQDFSPGKPFLFHEENYSLSNLNLKMWWGARVGVKVLLGR